MIKIYYYILKATNCIDYYFDTLYREAVLKHAKKILKKE